MATFNLKVATVLTACGIETPEVEDVNIWSDIAHVATVLTACGIETTRCLQLPQYRQHGVATVLTACGIETLLKEDAQIGISFTLQQYLPLAVLKRYRQLLSCRHRLQRPLQQYLPLAVLKLTGDFAPEGKLQKVATVLTACGIETRSALASASAFFFKLQQYLPLAVLKRENCF